MKIDLDRYDLESLVSSSSPPYEMFTELFERNLGKYVASHDEWSWSNLNLLHEAELYMLYARIKKERI